jgi:hypothetical protein
MSEKRLANRLKAVQRRIDLLEHFKMFLARNPQIYSYARLKNLSSGVGLEFEEKGFIRPLWQEGRPTLVLERWLSDEQYGEMEMEGEQIERFVSKEDVAAYSAEELAKALLEGINVDLSKPADYDPEDEEPNEGGA